MRNLNFRFWDNVTIFFRTFSLDCKELHQSSSVYVDKNLNRGPHIQYINRKISKNWVSFLNYAISYL